MLLPAKPPIANKISCHDVIINLKRCCGEDSASAEKALFLDAACLFIHRPNAAFQGAILSLKAPLNIPRPHGFLSRSWIGCHLNSIGWSDSPAVKKRLRAFAYPFCPDRASLSQQNFQATKETMKNTKFLVKVIRGTHPRSTCRASIDATSRQPPNGIWHCSWGS